MPRSIHDLIVVQLGSNGTAPAGFTWQGRRYVVRSLTACWKAVGPWWDGDGERTFFRVVAELGAPIANGKWQVANCKLGRRNGTRPTTSDQRPTTDAGIYELCYDHEGGRWFLDTVVD